MQPDSTAQHVRVYLSEGDTAEHQAAYVAILQLLRREHCAGATVTRGLMGFTHGRIVTATLADVATPLPVIIDWVDSAERVQHLLPRLSQLAPESLITVATVTVVHAPARAVQEVPDDLRVRDIMTPVDKVIAAPADASVHDLVVWLLRQGRHALPVLGAERRVVGIVTNRDLVERAGLPLRLELLRALGDPDDPAVASQLAGLHGAGQTAAAIMAAPVVTVGPDLPVHQAAKLLLQRRLKRLPVVDPANHLLGIVSRFDILKAATGNGPPRETPVPVRPPPGPAPRQIGAVMNRYVPAVRPATPLPDVLDAVMATRLHRAVVVDDAGQPVGMVVDTDLMQRVTPAAHPGLVQRLMHQVLTPTGESRAAWQRLTGQQAADVMRPLAEILVVRDDAALPDVIDRSLARKLKLIVVVDEAGRVVGMADRADLLAALAAS
jgi:CBS domain-containing protein